MALKSTPDILFKCPSCSGLLVAHSEAVGLRVVCPHCRQSIVIPQAPQVTDATLAPGVRRIRAKSKKEEAVNPLAAELAAMTLLYAETRVELAAVREELHQARLSEAESALQVDARIQDLQRQLDRVITRLATLPEQQPQL